MLQRLNWPTAAVVIAALAGGVTLSALHVTLPEWLHGIIAAAATAATAKLFAKEGAT